METADLLQIEHVSKRFNTVVALDDVSFSLSPGEVHCIVGENGAGKSTFIKILSGAIRPDCGDIRILDKNYPYLTPALARGLGIQTIYQETTVIPDLSVMENIFMGNEVRVGRLFVDRRRTRQRTLELLSKLSIDIDPDKLVRDLSTAEKQAVQVVRALAKRAKVLIMDEPTAAFGRREIRTLLELVRRLRETGTGVIYISHHLEEVFEIADRVTVLKDGVVVAHHSAAELDRRALVREMVGRDASLFYKRDRSEIGPTVLEVRNFSRGKAVRGVSLELRRGEILGVAGMVGSGRSELARMIYGADRRDSGELFIAGRRVELKSPADGIRSGLCLLPDDRKRDGIFLERDVKDNILIALQNKRGRPFINPFRELAAGEEYSRMLNVKTPSVKQLARYLSGGNQQKVLVARWLCANTRIFIFDEPTRGIDIGAKEEIYTLMVEMVKQGKSILMISSDMPELIAMSDRVVVMRGGGVCATLAGDEISEEAILTHSIGGHE
ncbi:MAG: sugar ABC transporter ATP-binding protein [Clostridiales bacterium]|nr:sugar ABC transporter ATP-binding protein [Clostridiales bacterium]